MTTNYNHGQEKKRPSTYVEGQEYVYIYIYIIFFDKAWKQFQIKRKQATKQFPAWPPWLGNAGWNENPIGFQYIDCENIKNAMWYLACGLYY